ncbi:MAG: tRNA uridine-5-carboxymethylaminomethyl(34) synthesis GTPase MnmE [Pseudomonadota bacterium]
MTTRDTIFALSSGRPPAAIAVVRISGPRAGAALEALIGRIPEPRRASLARIKNPINKEVLDEALALWFPGANSELGEDGAELQLHGGRAVIAGVLDALGTIEGLRLAEPGEFTRRAFENGRLDLTAVEGLADLIYAETQAQRRQAFRQMKGLLGDRAEGWRKRLIDALALVEARIDFPDEGDVPEDLVGPALKIAQELHNEIADALASAARGERLRDGLVVAIAGPPNAGKSTLLNRIARREAAIVSPIAGTTRDVIEVHLELDGYPVTLLDTAGIRDSNDPVEQEGVRRARERAAGADLVLWVVDATAPETGGEPGGAVVFGRPVPALAARPTADPSSPGQANPPSSIGAGESNSVDSPPLWVVRNKADLLGSSGLDSGEAPPPATSLSAGLPGLAGSTGSGSTGTRALPPLGGIETPKVDKIEHEFISSNMNSENIFILSTTDGKGVNSLLDRLTLFASQYFGSEPALVSRERQRCALSATQAALNRALAEGPDGRDDIVAEELRFAATALGRLTGRVDVEDILDVIFADFCIGK